MNKSQIREMANIAMVHKLGWSDTVARSLSALIRSAMRGKKAHAADTSWALKPVTTDAPAAPTLQAVA
jgi:hypothetical protein